jgi:hypothetical protein
MTDLKDFVSHSTIPVVKRYANANPHLVVEILDCEEAGRYRISLVWWLRDRIIIERKRLKTQQQQGET